MSSALTGGFDAVLEVRRKTLRRFLAAMHEHGGESLDDTLPRLPHNLVFRIGDDGALGGVRGKVWVQVGVPQLDVGSEIGPTTAGKVAGTWPVRAWFRADPGTAAFPSFIHGTLRATFHVTLETQAAGLTLRFTPVETIFTSNEMSAGVAGQVAQQALHFLKVWSSKKPFTVLLGPLDFALHTKGVGDTIAVALPLPEGQAQPPASMAGVSQDFTAMSGPADFAIAISVDYMLGLIQGLLDTIKATHPTFTVHPTWPLPDSTYTVHVKHAKASWSGNGSSGTLKVSVDGDATTPTILPNADWKVSLEFVLSFDSSAQTLVLTAPNDPTVDVDVHGPAGGLVEGKAENNVKAEIKKARDAAMPAAQAKVAAALPVQLTRLKGLLQQIVSYATVAVKWVHFGQDAVVFSGTIGMLPRQKAPQVAVQPLLDGSGYSAFANWLPGGWIQSYRWLWTSWTVDPVTGETTLEPVPGPVPGTHVWPHEEKVFKDRFVLQEGPGITLPGLDHDGPSHGTATHWQLCLYASGIQIDPKTGDEATYPLSKWGDKTAQPDASELITSILDAVVHPGQCAIGETGKPIKYSWHEFIRWMQPDPAMVEIAGLWVKQTWLDDTPRPGGGVYVGHLDLLATARAGPSGRAAVFQFVAGESPASALQMLGGALRDAAVPPDAIGVQLIFKEGVLDRLDRESAQAIRTFARAFPAVRVLALEDVQSGWSRMLRVPAEFVSRGSIRILDASGLMAFAAEGRADPSAVVAALRQLSVDRVPAHPAPLVPIVGSGTPPGDLLLEPVPGRPIRLRQLRGRPVVLAFVRSWSTPCLALLHEISGIYRRLADRGVTVAGVLTGADAARAVAFQSERQLPFPVVADPSAAAAASCAIRLWPTLVWMEGERQVWTRAGATSAAMAAWTRVS